MNLIAMMVVKDELDRYLKQSVPALLEFCDSVYILDDGSTDGSTAFLNGTARVEVMSAFRSTFYEHEGQTRQRLLDWTISDGQPTHILSIDADEFIADGFKVRRAITSGNQTGVWGIEMEEIWRAEDDRLFIRSDHAWKPHPIPILFEVPRRRDGNWKIANRALACGREPMTVSKLYARERMKEPVTEVLHFGWANEADRDARYQRYVTHDSGAYHNNAHLESIMWPETRVGLTPRKWPESIDKPAVLARAQRGRVAT